MSKNHEKAKEIFAKHSKKDTLHFTSDGHPFFEENPAQNHANTLKDKSLTKVTRYELAEAQESDAENDGDEQKADIGNTEGGDIKAPEIKPDEKADEKADPKKADAEKEKADKGKA